MHVQMSTDFSIDSLDEEDVKPLITVPPLHLDTTDPGDVHCNQSSDSSSLTSVGDTRPPPQQASGINLSPWEKWMINKTKIERTKEEQDHLKAVEDLRHKREERKKEKEKRKKAEKAYIEWIQSKAREQCSRKKQERRQEIAKQAEIAEKRKTKAKKEKESYEQWCHNKLVEKRLQKEKAEKERQLQDEEVKARQAKAEEAYQQWLRSVKRRGTEWWRPNTDGSCCHTKRWLGPLEEGTGQSEESLPHRTGLNITFTYSARHSV